ncbi:MarR family winged helix-turn-helix transcriptional regulator [Streptomyces varsoviensis]|uniref:Transcriptional regulator n=1 Tax=Streptomyces varsoviensis TaxID=67373 RepID=A0ABR5J9R0_9ACTN|nr:MarR family winged helix-turn-helix transcriptional regulator [Streptomyces varsoviensis]KOG90181.1 hypothetical protein ADK38_10175 [Streptomyces varsoviensis]
MSTPTTPATAVSTTPDPDMSDEELAWQPIGYWSGVAHQAVITYIRDAMARAGITQPQWWILNQVEGAPAGRTREELEEALANVAGDRYEIYRSVDIMLHREWLVTAEDGRLRLTDAGRATKARIKERVIAIRGEMHDGITDEEYVAALKVLRRMIRNTGGSEGWH